MTIKCLFLDDDSIRHEIFKLNNERPGIEITYAWTAKQAIKWLQKDSFNYLFLDHDLAMEHYNNKKVTDTGTGMEVVNYICKDLPADKKPDAIVVHSWNSIRGVEMVARLVEAKFTATYSPFDAKNYFRDI